MSGVVRLIDMVFPGDTNHHGTLFGGVALAHMDKVAFLAASRHGRAPFVTAASERIDFTAPALKGELIEATGRVVRAGTRSVDVEIELTAEELLSGARRLCTRGLFTLVAVKGPDTQLPLPPLDHAADPEDGRLHMADMVFPPQTNHYGTLFGGDALRMLTAAPAVFGERRLIVVRGGGVQWLPPDDALVAARVHWERIAGDEIRLAGTLSAVER